MCERGVAEAELRTDVAAVKLDAAVDGEAPAEVEIAGDMNVDSLQRDVAGVVENGAAEADRGRDRGTGQDDPPLGSEARVEGEALGDLDMVGVQCIATGVAQGGALQVELAVDGGTGYAESSLDSQVGAQRVTTNGHMDRGYRLGPRCRYHSVAEVQVTVDLGAVQDEGSGQVASGQHQ